MSLVPMAGMLREVAPGLWVGSQEARGLAAEFSLVLDCRAGGADAGNIRVLAQSGPSDYAWAPGDLDRAAALIGEAWPPGPVLVHCNRGVSRSTVAACAALITSGVCATPEEALARARSSARPPANVAIGALKRWFEGRART